MLLKSTCFVALTALTALTPALSVAVERSDFDVDSFMHWKVVGCKPLPVWCHARDVHHGCGCTNQGKYRCKTPAFTHFCKHRGCKCHKIHPSFDEYDDENDMDQSLVDDLLDVMADLD